MRIDEEELSAFLDSVCRPDVERVIVKQRHRQPHDAAPNAAGVKRYQETQHADLKRQKPSSNSVFLTNLSKQANQSNLREWICNQASVTSSSINRLDIALDKIDPKKSAGWCIVNFDPSLDREQLIASLNYKIFLDRCVYASPVASSSSPHTDESFHLPDDLVSQLYDLVTSRKLSGGSIGRLSDSYRRTYGKKAPVEVYGFRTFTQALKSVKDVHIDEENGTFTWPLNIVKNQ